ncbi:MAG: hypothetical protein MK209_02710, partial [Planctomycetes bacterium]|nr:hypothetical protein [Planctomycetota bacterium]
MGGAQVMWPAIQQSIPNARAVLAHDVAVRNADHDLRDVASINLYLEAGAAAEARAGIEARLADMPNDSYGEAALIEWYCWDPIFHEDGIVAAKSWLIQHEDLGLTPDVQVRADFLKER